MAKTLFFGKLPPPFGRGAKIAMGTIYAAGDDGSFAITDDSTGSKVMRNIQSVVLTPMVGTYSVAARGSSDGYVHLGVFLQAGGTTEVAAGTVPCNFIAFGGYGSI